MIVKQLKLLRFRNIAAMTLHPHEATNLICGDNAQGKTNLLEALFLCAGHPSFRTEKGADLVQFGGKTAEITMTFADRLRTQIIQMELARSNATSRNLFRVNGVDAGTRSERMGHFYCTVFTPCDLTLATGSPRERRGFLDRAIAQMVPTYEHYRADYERVLEQRNALLKQALSHPISKDTLRVWDSQLAKFGTVLSIYRADYIRKLAQVMVRVYAGISAGREVLSATYQSTVFSDLASGTTYHQALADQYLQKVQESLPTDLRLGYTSVGVHRDDLLLMLDDLPLRQFGSRGQIRSSVLALKLSEATLLEKIVGEPPVILLDDVMSELDPHRQHYILHHLGKRQIFITCCDAAESEIFNNFSAKCGKVFCLSEGALFETSQNPVTPP